MGKRPLPPVRQRYSYPYDDAQNCSVLPSHYYVGMTVSGSDYPLRVLRPLCSPSWSRRCPRAGGGARKKKNPPPVVPQPLVPM
jgi:hypothetical protein